jgi:hypothetical protein
MKTREEPARRETPRPGQAVAAVIYSRRGEGEETMPTTYCLRYAAFAALMSGALVLGMVASGTCAAEADRDSSAARRVEPHPNPYA